MRLPCFNMDLPDPPAGTIMTDGSIFGIALGDGNVQTYGSFWVTATASESIRPFDHVTTTSNSFVGLNDTQTLRNKKFEYKRQPKQKLSYKERRAMR